MGTRLDLQTLLETLTDNVYFQPPENLTIQYPCIVYNRDYQSSLYADNGPFRRMVRWMVTVIDRDPDSLIPDKVGALPLSSFVRHFTADQLNHDIYNLYF